MMLAHDGARKGTQGLLEVLEMMNNTKVRTYQ